MVISRKIFKCKETKGQRRISKMESLERMESQIQSNPRSLSFLGLFLILIWTQCVQTSPLNKDFNQNRRSHQSSPANWHLNGKCPHHSIGELIKQSPVIIKALGAHIFTGDDNVDLLRLLQSHSQESKPMDRTAGLNLPPSMWISLTPDTIYKGSSLLKTAANLEKTFHFESYSDESGSANSPNGETESDESYLYEGQLNATLEPLSCFDRKILRILPTELIVFGKLVTVTTTTSTTTTTTINTNTNTNTKTNTITDFGFGSSSIPSEVPSQRGREEEAFYGTRKLLNPHHRDPYSPQQQQQQMEKQHPKEQEELYHHHQFQQEQQQLEHPKNEFNLFARNLDGEEDAAHQQHVDQVHQQQQQILHISINGLHRWSPQFENHIWKLLGWDDWSDFTVCSVACGKGVQQRFRRCLLDNPMVSLKMDMHQSVLNAEIQENIFIEDTDDTNDDDNNEEDEEDEADDEETNDDKSFNGLPHDNVAELQNENQVQEAVFLSNEIEERMKGGEEGEESEEGSLSFDSANDFVEISSFDSAEMDIEQTNRILSKLSEEKPKEGYLNANSKQRASSFIMDESKEIPSVEASSGMVASTSAAAIANGKATNNDDMLHKSHQADASSNGMPSLSIPSTIALIKEDASPATSISRSMRMATKDLGRTDDEVTTLTNAVHFIEKTASTGSGSSTATSTKNIFKDASVFIPSLTFTGSNNKIEEAKALSEREAKTTSMDGRAEQEQPKELQPTMAMSRLEFTSSATNQSHNSLASGKAIATDSLGLADSGKDDTNFTFNESKGSNASGGINEFSSLPKHQQQLVAGDTYVSTSAPLKLKKDSRKVKPVKKKKKHHKKRKLAKTISTIFCEGYNVEQRTCNTFECTDDINDLLKFYKKMASVSDEQQMSQYPQQQPSFPKPEPSTSANSETDSSTLSATSSSSSSFATSSFPSSLSSSGAIVDLATLNGLDLQMAGLDDDVVYNQQSTTDLFGSNAVNNRSPADASNSGNVAVNGQQEKEHHHQQQPSLPPQMVSLSTPANIGYIHSWRNPLNYTIMVTLRMKNESKGATGGGSGAEVMGEKGPEAGVGTNGVVTSTIFSIRNLTQNLYLEASGEGLKLLLERDNSTEMLPMKFDLYDNRWHQVAISVQNGDFISIFIDCSWTNSFVVARHLFSLPMDTDVEIGRTFNGELQQLLVMPGNQERFQCSSKRISINEVKRYIIDTFIDDYGN